MPALVYKFNHHYGLMDNIKGMFLIFLICHIKKYCFYYTSSALHKFIDFDRYLNKTYLKNDLSQSSHNMRSYACHESNDRLLNNLYYDTVDIIEDYLFVETNIDPLFAFNNILDEKFIKNFIYLQSKNLLNLHYLYANNNIIDNKYITIHYRFGDKIIMDANLMCDELIKKAELSLQKLILSISFPNLFIF